jgi:hypothetical protein
LHSIGKLLYRAESNNGYRENSEPHQVFERRSLKIMLLHKLFTHGFCVFFLQSVAQNYAAYLERKRYYHEASLLYERAGCLELAVGAADRSGNWRRADRLARRAGWAPADRLGQLWRSMAARLEGEGRGEESATIHREMLQVPLLENL